MTHPATPDGPTVLVLGEEMRVFITGSGESVARATAFRSSIAGAEGNVAIGLSRQGIAARFVGRIGDDDSGAFVLRALRAEGLDTADVVVDPESFTGLLIRNSSAHQAISVSYHRAGSAASRVGADDVRAAFARRTPDLVHVTGISAMLSDTALGAVRQLFDEASARAIPISIDVNLRLRIASADRWSQVLLPLLERATIIFAGDAELDAVGSGTSGDALIAGWLSGAAELVVRKNADHSCTAFARGAEPVTQSTLVTTVVDPVGAGDALVAGFLAGHLSGEEPAACLRRGAATAAFAVGHWSDVDGLPDSRQLTAFLSALDAGGAEQVVR